jgi:hypothetical protein
MRQKLSESSGIPSGGTDVGGRLLEEYLDLKEQLGPLEKRLEQVRDRLRDLVTERGHFVDEARGVLVSGSLASVRSTTRSDWRHPFRG